MSSTSLDLRRPETRGVDYVERARALAPMLAAAADEIEERRQLPEHVVEALIEGGFFRLLLPRSLGGAELDPVTYVQVLEEIAKADPSTAWSLGQNSGCSMTAPYLDPAVAREIFGPPRGILAWGPELPGAGRGIAVEGGIRVTGRWGFATGPARHLARRACSDLQADGTAPQPNGRPFVRTISSQDQRRDHRQLAGHRAARHRQRQLRLDDLVPQKYTASRDNEAERREPGLLYRFTSGMIYASSFSNVSLGIARGALDAFIELARDKIPRGARKTLRENNVIQSEVAQSEAKLRSSRAFIHATGGRTRRSGDFAQSTTPGCGWPRPGRSSSPATSSPLIYGAAAGSNAVNENLFERRLRDVHAGPNSRPPGPFRNRRPDPPALCRRAKVPVTTGRPSRAADDDPGFCRNREFHRFSPQSCRERREIRLASEFLQCEPGIRAGLNGNRTTRTGKYREKYSSLRRPTTAEYQKRNKTSHSPGPLEMRKR